VAIRLSRTLITAYGDAETKRQALENGAEALLTKPIDFGTLALTPILARPAARAQQPALPVIEHERGGRPPAALPGPMRAYRGSIELRIGPCREIAEKKMSVGEIALRRTGFDRWCVRVWQLHPPKSAFKPFRT
jgi:hypothetical protein